MGRNSSQGSHAGQFPAPSRLQEAEGSWRSQALGFLSNQKLWGVAFPQLNSVLPVALRAPSSRGPRVPRERAHWPLDGTVTQQSCGRLQNRQSGEEASLPPLEEPGQLVQVVPSSWPARGVDWPPAAALCIPGQAAASATKTGCHNQSLSVSPWGRVPGECGPSSFACPSHRRTVWSSILKLEVFRKIS